MLTIYDPANRPPPYATIPRGNLEPGGTAGGLLGAWAFSEQGGAAIHDAVRNTPGCLVGGPAWGPAGVTTVRTSSQYVDCGPGACPTGPRTIEIIATITSAYPWGRIWDDGVSMAYYSSGGNDGTAMGFGVQLRSAGWYGYEVVSFPSNQRNHMLISWDGTPDSPWVECLNGSISTVKHRNVGSAPAPNHLRLFCGFAGEYTSGTVELYCIYGRALTIDEMLARCRNPWEIWYSSEPRIYSPAPRASGLYPPRLWQRIAGRHGPSMAGKR